MRSESADLYQVTLKCHIKDHHKYIYMGREESICHTMTDSGKPNSAQEALDSGNY